MIGAQSQRGSRGWLLIALRWAAALLVLGVLLYFLPVGLLRAAIARVPLSSFLLVLLGYLLAHSVGLAKWRVVVNAAGAELDLATSAQCYAGGLFGTLFLPSICRRRHGAVGGGAAAQPAASGSFDGQFAGPLSGRNCTGRSCAAGAAAGSRAGLGSGRPGRHAAKGFSESSAGSACIARRDVSDAQASFRRPLGALSQAVGAAEARAAHDVETSACAGARLAARHVHAARFPHAYSTTRGLLRANTTTASVALRLAAGETCRGVAANTGRHRSAGSRAGGAAFSLWSARASGAGGRLGVGRRGDRRRANRGVGGASAPEASR